LSLSNNKSPGPDEISAKLLKENCYIFCEPLQYIYNLSLCTGVVPQKLKFAKVIPVFKQGDSTSASNYRPISLLSIFNKMLEKLVHRRLYSFFDKYNVLYKYQFGFRKNHSTSLAVLEVIDTCYKNLDNNNKILGIYFDLSKAFDTVDHTILLSKLFHYGIRGTMHDWLTSYLSNRMQYTVVNNVSSKIGSISCGVPQGSVLGPLLFLIYMNDIHKAVPNKDLKLFADDTNLFLFGSDLKILEAEANDCLKKLEFWFYANKLSLNTEKTCYTAFKCNNKAQLDLLTFSLIINGKQINKVSSCKYLGVYIDDNFQWNEHIDYVYKKIVRFVGICYKLKGTVPKECLYKLYYAFIYPYIQYGV
jgi:hypothetical protein